MKLMSAMLED